MRDSKIRKNLPGFVPNTSSMASTSPRTYSPHANTLARKNIKPILPPNSGPKERLIISGLIKLSKMLQIYSMVMLLLYNITSHGKVWYCTMLCLKVPTFLSATAALCLLDLKVLNHLWKAEM